MLILFLFIFPVAYFVISSLSRPKPQAEVVPDLTWPGEAHLRSVFGMVNPRIVCPHCMRSGRVRVKELAPGEGSVGGKIGAAVVSPGKQVLMLAISPPEKRTQHFCQWCRTTWEF